MRSGRRGVPTCSSSTGRRKPPDILPPYPTESAESLRGMSSVQRRPSLEGRDPQASKPKAPRLDGASEGTQDPQTPSSKSKKALASVRTGQACDRCRSRKIRCDDTPGGCLPCRQNNTECRTTDRVTQRATLRGHTELIEHENGLLRQQVAELSEQLRQQGIEPKQSLPSPILESGIQPWIQSAGRSYEGGPNQSQAEQSAQLNDLALFSNSNDASGSAKYQISPTNLSPVRADALCLFGMRVELKDFVKSAQYDNDPISYRNVLRPLMKSETRDEYEATARFPSSYEEYVRYAATYIEALNPWLPVLSKPSFMELVRLFSSLQHMFLYSVLLTNEQVSKYYHFRHFEPTAAENVILHMAVAIAKYQAASRNKDSSLYDQAIAHCKYCLTFVDELTTARNLQSMQALTLICAMLRAWPSPEPAWMISTWTLCTGIEMNLHRSANAWRAEDPANRSVDEAEMRKRVFWSLLIICVHVTGKLGRPMPLRLEDFDIEIPEVLEDELTGTASNKHPARRQCSFELGIVMFKIFEINVDTYNYIYAVRPSGQYEEHIRRLEARAVQWRSELPPKYQTGDPAAAELPNLMFALWTDFWEAECQIILHHPALCRASSTETVSRNLGICTKAAWTIVKTNLQLCRLRSLDTTWQHTTTYIGAIFMILFSFWEKREIITHKETEKLEEDLATCDEVLLELGASLGSGNRLQERIRNIIDAGVGFLYRHLAEASANNSFTNTSAKPSSKQARAQLKEETPSPPKQQTDYNSFVSAGQGEMANMRHDPSLQLDTSSMVNHIPTNYGQVRFDAIASTPVSSTQAATHAQYAQQQYAYASMQQQHAQSSVEASRQQQAYTPAQAQATPDPFVFGSQQQQPHIFNVHGGPMAWHSFTEQIQRMNTIPFVNQPANVIHGSNNFDGVGPVNAGFPNLQGGMTPVQTQPGASGGVSGPNSSAMQPWPMAVGFFAQEQMRPPQ